MRRRNTWLYSEVLAGLDITALFGTDYTQSMYHLSLNRMIKKDELRERLVGSGISTGLHYLFPLRLQDPFGRLRCMKDFLNNRDVR